MWLKTEDDELINLDRCEGITVEEEGEYYEVNAHIPSGRIVIASKFSSYAEASQYIKDTVVRSLGLKSFV